MQKERDERERFPFQRCKCRQCVKVAEWEEDFETPLKGSRKGVFILEWKPFC